MISRRQVLKRTGAGAAAALGPWPVLASRATAGVVLNDVHSKLNASRVAGVARPETLDDLVGLVRQARELGQTLSQAGGRHSMGGQQFGAGTVNLDTRGLSRVLRFDRDRGIIEVEAGIEWPALIRWYLEEQSGRGPQWGIAQKQTGADRLTIGGALSANAHGRGLTLAPVVGDVESLTMVDVDGEPRRVSRTRDPELFSLVVGGYGLFGTIYSTELRLVPRRKLERVVEVRGAEGLDEVFEQRIRDGYLYGDFQFETDERSPTFLTRGVFACYRESTAAGDPPQNQRELAYDDWVKLLHVGHADKAEAWRRYSAYYLSTSGQVYWSDTQQLSIYPEDYHLGIDARSGAASPGSEMITEVYVPRPELPAFLAEAARALRELKVSVIYGTVRLIEPDRETFLPWARARYACTVFNLHVDHDPAGIEHARRGFLALIDLARARGGSFFLTYHRWATKEQVLDCYPQFPRFIARKQERDPDERYSSDWYRHHRDLLA